MERDTAGISPAIKAAGRRYNGRPPRARPRLLTFPAGFGDALADGMVTEALRDREAAGSCWLTSSLSEGMRILS